MRTITKPLIAATMLFLITGSSMAADPVCGDVNDSGGVSSADALLVLRVGVGQPITLQCAPPGGTLRTGQTTCWDPGDTTEPIATVSCGGTGQDGDILAGLTPSYTDNGNGTVTDNETGLTWEKLDDASGVHDYNTAFHTWASAFGKIAELNAGSFGGHNDWRLPNLKELFTLVDQGSTDPAVDAAFDSQCMPGCTVDNCSCTLSYGYWSATTYLAGPDDAWGVDFQDGVVGTYVKTLGNSVRAVRGG